MRRIVKFRSNRAIRVHYIMNILEKSLCLWGDFLLCFFFIVSAENDIIRQMHMRGILRDTREML